MTTDILPSPKMLAFIPTLPMIGRTADAVRLSKGASMSAIGDLVKLLDQIPIWRRINALPEQIEALQRRVQALEDEIKKRPAGERCPICEEGRLKVAKVEKHFQLGDLGIQMRTMKCDNPTCAHTEERIHDPSGRMGKT
jgi:hypothetical protein